MSAIKLSQETYKLIKGFKEPAVGSGLAAFCTPIGLLEKKSGPIFWGDNKVSHVYMLTPAGLRMVEKFENAIKRKRNK